MEGIDACSLCGARQPGLVPVTVCGTGDRFRGLRRGEAVGQDWTNIDLDAGLLTVAGEIVQDVWAPYESAPKTDSSANTIGLDNDTTHPLTHEVPNEEAPRPVNPGQGAR